MFLDDELTQIWNLDLPKEVKDERLCKACIARVSENNFFTDMRRVDNSFRLFAKMTEGVNPDAFRDFCVKVLGEDFRIAIGW